MRKWAKMAALSLLFAFPGLTSASDPQPRRFEDATRLSAFGERPAYSPDGKRIAFQMAERGTGEIGEGMGVYRIRIAP